MKINLKEWSERQQVLAVILMAGLVISALLYFMLLPQIRQRHKLQRDISRMKSELERKNYLLDENALKKRKADAQRQHQEAIAEWHRMSGRLGTFPDQDALTSRHVGHIDFKVALFDVRERLRSKSRQLRIGLPFDLGMDDSVRSSEDARRLMLQLRAVEKLVDACLNLRINSLRHIAPLKPIQHKAGLEAEAYFEEYPVRAEFFGSLENLYDLLAATRDPEQVFVIKNLQVRAASARRPGLLTIKATMSALIFLKSPDELTLVEEKRTRRRTPLGH